MVNEQYKIKVIFKSKKDNKVLHSLESVINKKETMEEYKDERIFRNDIDDINDKLINALKLFGQKWILLKGENRTEITVPVEDNEFDLRLAVTLQQLVLSVENHPNIYRFELVNKSSKEELNKHLITRLNKQYTDVVYVISSVQDKDSYFVIYKNVKDSLINIPLLHKWKDSENKIHDLLNTIEEVETVICKNDISTTSITFIKSSNHLTNIITEYTNCYNEVEKRYHDLMNGLDITQGLDDKDNPDLANDLLMKLNQVYEFDNDNEHDIRVFNHSLLNYHNPDEGKQIGYVIIKQDNTNKSKVIIADAKIMFNNIQNNKSYLDTLGTTYGNKVGFVNLSTGNDIREIIGIGIYLENLTQSEYDNISNDILHIVARGKPIYG